MIVSTCDDYPGDFDPPPSDAEYKAWTKAASRTCDYCFLAKAKMKADFICWQCHSCDSMMCGSCADSCPTTTCMLWNWYQREVECELPLTYEDSDERRKRRDRNRKREEECLRHLNDDEQDAAAEHDNKKARQLSRRRELKQLTLQF